MNMSNDPLRASSLRLVPSIHRATHRIGLFLAALRDDDLSQGESHILAHLATAGPSTIAELHRWLAHNRSTLTSTLDRLTARGLVTREVGKEDRRTFLICPTPKGRVAARKVHRHLTALERSVLNKVSAEDVRAFSKVVAALEDEANRGQKGETTPNQLASKQIGGKRPSVP
jgi:DNA-binding MarR family transcriptional regulator